MSIDSTAPCRPTVISQPRPAPLRALAATCAVVVGAVLLSACSTAPKSPSSAGSDSAVEGAGQPAASAKPRRGGGYYKDDGPDDVPPDNLDAIPDAEPRREPLHRFANRPYNVFGQGYVPVTQVAAFRERGRASWYGRRFHGNPTSSGEPYDMYAMTAAHPTLPIPSYVRVTRVDNGRSVVVRVNDRGPFHKGRIIDLSYTAAHKLGYINSGSAEVEVEQILPDEAPLLTEQTPVPPLPGRRPAAPEPAAGPAAGLAATALPPLDPAAGARADVGSAASAPAPAGGLVPPMASASAGIFLQLGAFSSFANAEGFRASVEREAAAFAERLELFADGERFRLHAGPYDSVDEARAVAERLGAALRLRPFVVVR